MNKLWSEYLIEEFQKIPLIDWDKAYPIYFTKKPIYIRVEPNKVLFLDGRIETRFSLPDFVLHYPKHDPMEGDAEAIYLYVKHLIESDAHNGGCNNGNGYDFSIRNAKKHAKQLLLNKN